MRIYMTSFDITRLHRYSNEGSREDVEARSSGLTWREVLHTIWPLAPELEA